MASLTIQFPDAQAARIVDALCFDGGLDTTTATQQEKNAFAKAQVAAMLKARVQEIEHNRARAAVTPPDPVDAT
jgi:hypothetical protein